MKKVMRERRGEVLWRYKVVGVELFDGGGEFEDRRDQERERRQTRSGRRRRNKNMGRAKAKAEKIRG